MIQVNQSYIQACESKERKGYVVARLGESNPETKESVYSTMVIDNQPFSDITKLYDEDTQENSNYISCEPNRVKLDGTYKFIYNKSQITQQENIAYWGKHLSNNNRTFEYSEMITIRLSSAYPFMELTLFFGDVCEEFVVRYSLRDVNGNLTLKATRTINNNNSLVVSTSGQPISSDVKFNYVVIEFYKTKEPYRYIKVNEIDFGGIFKFEKEQIESYDIINEISINNNELPAKSLNLTINDYENNYDITNPNNKLSQLLAQVKNIKIDYFILVGKSYKQISLGTFFVDNCNVENQKLKFECYDIIYYLTDIYYGSNFYNGVEVKQIFRDVFDYFGYTNYEINISDDDNIKLFGYVPNVEFREALRIIAEASSLIVTTNRYGKIVIYKRKAYSSENKISKKFTRNLIFKENHKLESDNAVNFTLYDYSFNINNKEEIYNETLPIGVQTIQLNNIVIPSSIEKVETNSDYEIQKQYALNCVVNVKKETTVKLKASIVTERKENYIYNKKYVNTNCINIDNPLINYNTNEIESLKTGSNRIIFNFDTLLMPYLEEGDICLYNTKYNDTKFFRITKMEFSNSIIQNIEGEQ